MNLVITANPSQSSRVRQNNLAAYSRKTKALRVPSRYTRSAVPAMTPLGNRCVDRDQRKLTKTISMASMRNANISY